MSNDTDDYQEGIPDPSEIREMPNWTGEIIYALSLSDAEMTLRSRFVDEYLVDYDAYAACLRLGMAAGPSYKYSQNFMRDAYVQHLLAGRTYKRELQKQEEDSAEAAREADRTKQQIIEGLKREAFYTGPGSKQSARVAALSKLAALYGLEKDPSREDEGIPKGGVMVLPAMLTPEQWQSVAAQQQKTLADETASDVNDE